MRNAESLKRHALRALGLVIVVPALVIIYLFQDHMEGKGLALTLLLFLSALGFYLVWSIIRAMSSIQEGLVKMARGETQSLNISEAPSQLREMTDIITALNNLTIEFRENASQLQGFIQQFAALAELTEVTAKLPNIQELLTLVLTKALSGSHATRGTVMFVKPDRENFEVAAAEGWTPQIAKTIPIVGTLAKRVVDSGKPLLVENLSKAQGISVEGLTDAELYRSESFMILPLKAKSDVLGVVCVSDKATGGPFSNHDQQFLQVLLGHVGYAVENARLLNQAREAARDLKVTVRDQEIKIKTAQGMYLQAEKLSALGQLAGGVAHDFNNLLQAVLAYTKLAQQDLPEDSRSRSDLDQVYKAAERAAGLTRQLLAFGRRQLLQPQYLNLNHEIEEFTMMIRRLIGENIELEVVPSQELATVHVDASQIEQVLLNLSINARDAIANHGKIKIATRNVTLDASFCDAYDAAPGNYVLLEVTDDGCGMSEEVLLQIFEPFFTTKEVGRGTGLGLATVYGIVRQHNGIIRVTSTPGVGSVFSVYFPAVDHPAEVNSRPASHSTAGGTETILVAEDEETVRNLMIRVLSKVGYNVLSAHDGEAAIAAFDANEGISLAVLDAIMPRKSGRDVYEHIHEHRPDVKVLFCSGYNASAVDTGFTGSGNLPVLQKPFDPDELVEKVRTVLDASTVVYQ